MTDRDEQERRIHTRKTIEQMKTKDGEVAAYGRLLERVHEHIEAWLDDEHARGTGTNIAAYALSQLYVFCLANMLCQLPGPAASFLVSHIYQSFPAHINAAIQQVAALRAVQDGDSAPETLAAVDLPDFLKPGGES